MTLESFRIETEDLLKMFSSSSISVSSCSFAYFSRRNFLFLFKKNLATKSKSKSDSSHRWLQRQKSDPFVRKAKELDFRARSAFKLIEIDERFEIFRPGQTVLDFGAAPGSWAQVVVPKINSDFSDPKKPCGILIAVDRDYFEPLAGAKILANCDIFLPETLEKILKILEAKKIDVFLSDLAPNATGSKEMDHLNIIKLCYAALNFAIPHLEKNSAFLCKIWDGIATNRLKTDLLKIFSNVKSLKPRASRENSAEIFLLARGFQKSAD